RRYVESLSAYARQFLGQMDKPDLDSIDGLSPAVSIDQRTTSRNPRSTVGTVTEIYDYLRLLFARIGIPHCYECGRVISRQTTDQVVDQVLEGYDEQRVMVLSPVITGRKGEYGRLFQDLQREGFARVRVDGEVRELGEPIVLDRNLKHDIDVIIDRLVARQDSRSRLAEAIETATTMAEGNVSILMPDSNEEIGFSLALACPEHGHSMDDLAPRDFSFNAPYGACPECSGLGYKREVDQALIIPDPTLSLADGAFAVVSKTSNYYPQMLAAVARHIDVNINTPWGELNANQQSVFLHGLGTEQIRLDYTTRDGRDTYWYVRFDGLLKMTADRYEESSSDTVRSKMEEYFSTMPCSTCNGARLKPEILAVTVGDSSIHQVTQLSARDSLSFFEQLNLQQRELMIGERIVKEIVERLRFLVDVGLDYLTLERATASLSGGEAQRIRLATQIGAGLMGVLYILDEPSIGLHQRDNGRLISTLKRLRDLGNTVIIVEHDEETIRSADHIIDMGPGAGEHGGSVVAEGGLENILAEEASLTGAYLSGRREIPIPEQRRNPERGQITIKGARTNNLKNIDIAIELGTLTLITGVSGSGKSSLVADTLAPALTNRIHRSRRPEGVFESISGLAEIDKVIDIDQSPIGRTPRSNPATYVGLWDDVRSLFASLPESKVRGYAPGRFSFNVAGGRCEACKGDGQIKIEMHFLPDIYVPCEVCKGSRYNRETLQVSYRGKTVADVLDMSVSDALDFFSGIPKLKRKLQTLEDVGLGYIRLGQPATTLSGGEAQRVKLASELQRVQTGKTFYILDEPTTGLHFEDVRQLLQVLERLVDKGNTVVVIEHNLDMIKSADRVIDLGPEGGLNGGELIAYGTPEQVAATAGSFTGEFLAELFNRSGHAY
ncbi:MAG: excinuclease ABC subunit UvrA, partial [Coriobacteriia bacterium]|nr:excinuclease ABC subunit UvrA [Coriobacteriia bacterium]